MTQVLDDPAEDNLHMGRLYVLQYHLYSAFWHMQHAGNKWPHNLFIIQISSGITSLLGTYAVPGPS